MTHNNIEKLQEDIFQDTSYITEQGSSNTGIIKIKPKLV